MRNLIKTFLLIMMLSFSHTTLADDYEDGFAAAQKGDVKTALKLWKPLADQGNASAQYFIGWMYENGQGLSQDYKAAVKWYTLAAEQGYTPAQRNLFFIYSEGKGVAQDLQQTKKWLILISESEQSNKFSQYKLGWMYGSNPDGDYETAFRNWKALADKGDAYGQIKLGWMCNFGHGVAQDYMAAIKLFTLAGEQGNIEAQIILGKTYAYGQNVPQDYKTAGKWYTLAAEKGNAEAQYNLGEMYAEGQGVAKNHDTAIKWFTLAAEQGHEAAHYNLALKYYEGDGVAQDYRTAARWFELPAEKDNILANLYLGIMYMNGLGVEQDYVKAYMFLNFSATKHNKVAIKNRSQLVKKMTPAQIERASNLIDTKKIETTKLDNTIIEPEKDASNAAKQMLSEARSTYADAMIETDKHSKFDVYQHIRKSFKLFSQLPNCTEKFKDLCWGWKVNIGVSTVGRIIEIFEGVYLNNKPNGFGIRTTLDEHNKDFAAILNNSDNIDFEKLILSESQVDHFIAGVFNSGHLNGLVLEGFNSPRYLLGIATRGIINGEAIELNKFNHLVNSGYYFDGKQIFKNPVNFFSDKIISDLENLQPSDFISYKSKQIHFCKVDGKNDDCFGTYFTKNGYKFGELTKGKINGYGCHLVEVNSIETKDIIICGMFKDDEAYEGNISYGSSLDFEYEGTIKSGLPHGKGKALIAGKTQNKTGKILKFSGEFFEGKLLSQAIVNDGGSIYRGDFYNSMKNGSGTSFDGECTTVSQQIWKDNHLISEERRQVNQDEFNQCVNLRDISGANMHRWLPDGTLSPVAPINSSADPYYKLQNFDLSAFKFD